MPVEADNDETCDIESMLKDLSKLSDDEEEEERIETAVKPATCQVQGCKAEVGLERCAWRNYLCFRCKRSGGCNRFYCIDHSYTRQSAKLISLHQGRNKFFERQGCQECMDAIKEDAKIDMVWLLYMPCIMISMVLLALFAYYKVSNAEESCDSWMGDACYAI